MNCRRTRRAVAGLESLEIPPAVTAHLGACAPCRQWRERDAAVRRLLQFKRHEQPDDYLEPRLGARIRAAVAGEAARRRALGWREAFPTFSAPIVRYGIAALFLGMMTFHFVSAPQPSLVTGSAARHSIALGGVWPAAPTVHTFDAPRDDFLFVRHPWAERSPLSVTNLGSVGIHQGIGVWRVSYEY